MKLNKRERIMEHKNISRELSNSIQHNNISIIGVPEEEREKGEIFISRSNSWKFS